jgi:hypothetical protein
LRHGHGVLKSRISLIHGTVRGNRKSARRFVGGFLRDGCPDLAFLLPSSRVAWDFLD